MKHYRGKTQQNSKLLKGAPKSHFDLFLLFCLVFFFFFFESAFSTYSFGKRVFHLIVVSILSTF